MMVDKFIGLTTTVVNPNEDMDDDILRLEVKIYEEWDVCEFYLNGNKIFSGDWTSNFGPLFMKALEACQPLGESGDKNE